MIAPRSASKCEIAACTNSAGITLRLIDGSRDVLASPLCFDNADKGQADEQGIVGRAACGGPFRNGEIASFHRPCAGSVSHLLRIRLPSAVSQLLIDERPCFSFIETDGLCRCLRKLQNLLLLGCRAGLCCRLQACQLLGNLVLGSFGLGGQLFPQRPFFGCPFRSRLGGQTSRLCIGSCCLGPLRPPIVLRPFPLLACQARR